MGAALIDMPLLSLPSLQLLLQVVCFYHEHIHESSFSVVQVAGDGNVSCLIGVVHEI